MRRFGVIGKTFTAGLVSCACLLAPLTSYASGCSYSQSAYDPVNDATVHASHRCEVYSDNVYMRTSTDGNCTVEEWVNLTGKFNDDFYDDSAIGYMAYEEVDGRTVEDWASDYFNGSLSEVQCARPDFGICAGGDWSWANGYKQSAD